MCVEQAEKENNIFSVSKVNALKRKSEAEKEDVAKLEQALSPLEERRKKLSCLLILKACVMLMFLYYFAEKF